MQQMAQHFGLKGCGISVVALELTLAGKEHFADDACDVHYLKFLLLDWIAKVV